MVTRRERVVLELEDNFTSGMARAAAAAALLNKELEGSGRRFDANAKSTDRFGTSLSKMHGELDKANVEVERLSERAIPTLNKRTEETGNQIDRLSGRLALFAQAAAVLGPALIPVGAAAIPVLAGLTTQMGLAGAAAGVTVLAFHGVGDALKALNAYDLDPSAANFAKLQESMHGLGPAAREFVTYLHTISPELDRIRKDAQGGVLPGAEDGLKSLMRLAPQAEQIIGNVAVTVGDLFAEAGDNLDSPKWRAFFDYLRTDAAPILVEMAHTLGNAADGLAAMVLAFAPLTTTFSSGFEDMSKSFAHWAEGLSASDGFQSFLAYVQNSGPKVLDLVGALANMLIQVVTAAAPLGGPVLQALTAVANIVADLAESDLGTPIFTAAAAFAVLSRATAAWGAVGKSSVGQFITGQKTLQGTLTQTQTLAGRGASSLVASYREATAATDALRAAEERRAAAASRARDAQFALIPGSGKRAALDAHTAAQGDVVAAAERVVAAEKTKADAVRRTAGAIGKSAALVGGFAVASSGVADKVHLANTASLALMGTIAGPWGAAVGGAVGLALDFASASHKSAVNQQALNDAAKGVAATLDQQTGALTASTRQAAEKALADQGVYDAAQKLGINLNDLTAAYLGNAEAAGRVGGRMNEVQGAATDAGQVMSGPVSDAFDLVTSAVMTQGSAMSSARRHILQAKQASDEHAAATRRAAAAQRDETMTTGELIDKLQRLNNANLANRGSIRDYKAALDDARKSLHDNGRTLNDNTEKGRANAAALDAIASAAIHHAQTMKDDGKSVGRVNGYLQQSRRDLIDAAKHFGMTGKEARNYANDVLKIPKDARTKAIFDHQVAKNQIRDYVKYVNEQLHGGIHDEAVKITLSAQAQRVHDEISTLNRAEGGPAVWGAGPVSGPGTETSDSINAKLSNNEHVVAAAEVRAFGHGSVQQGHKNIELWRQAALHNALPDPRDLPKFADGGPVLKVQTARQGSIAASANAYFASIAAQVGKAMSKQAEQAFSMGGNGSPLGPNGSLSLGQLVAGQRFARAQDGKPYIWGGVGPRGYDCSGFQSAILNAAHGRNPYSRIGSTGSMPWPGSRPGVGRYTIGWFQGSPGHTSGNIGGLGVESTGDHVRTGRAARSPMNSMFRGHMHYAKGGAVEVPLIGLSDEYMMSGDAVRHYGVQTFDAMNARRLHTGGPVGFANGGRVTATAPASVTRQISARITEMRNALDTSKFYHSLVPYIRRRLSGKQEETYLARAHKAFVSDLKRNDMDRIRAATTALRKSDTPNKDYARLTAFIRSHLSGREERDRLRMAKDAFDSDIKKRRDAELAAVHKKHVAAVNKATDALNKMQDRLKGVVGQRNALAGQVSSSFVSDPFGGTLGGFDSQMRYETRRLGAANKDLAKLAKAGMGPGFLSQLASSGNAALVHQFAGLSRSQLVARQSAFNQRNRLDQAVGATVGDAVYGRRIGELTLEVVHLRHELERLRKGKHIGNQHTHFHGNVNGKNATEIAKQINKKQQVAARRARHR